MTAEIAFTNKTTGVAKMAGILDAAWTVQSGLAAFLGRLSVRLQLNLTCRCKS